MWSLTTRWARVLRVSKPIFRYECVESLYSASALGIDKFIEAKEKTIGQFANSTDKYRAKMEDFVSNENMVFTEDLRNMIYLAKKNDINLLELMIKKFNGQNKELRFGNFIFGPIVMRMYHSLDLPDAAVNIFEDPDTATFFDQVISYQILLDLLYKHEKYEDMIRVFELIKDKQLNMKKYPRNIVTLMMAACYKQNTKESLQFAVNLWNDLLKVGHEPLKKAITFFAGLAINQNAPHYALEALTNVREQTYITIRNLKAAALADLDRPGDVIPILRHALDRDSPTGSTNLFTQDTISKIEKSVKRLANKEIEREFEHILKSLSNQKLIQTTDLDQILCQDINYSSVGRNPKFATSDQSFIRNKNSYNVTVRRQGLHQMY